MSVFGAREQNSSGFTIVELIVSMVVTVMLIVSIVGVVSTWLGQYSAGNTRSKQSANLQTALTRISTDVRQSYTVLSQNVDTDTDAPTTPGSWQTGTNQLVLGKTPRNASGTALYDTPLFFSGKPDSIVYYLKNGTIYRRIVPASGTNYATNANTLITCTPSASGGCPNDMAILSGVTQLQFTYYDSSNNSGATPTDTRSVAVSITASQQQSGQTITATDSVRTNILTLTALVPDIPSGTTDPPASPQTSASIAAGPGGLQLGFANINSKDIYVKGQAYLQYFATVNTNSSRFDVANVGCGTRTTFPTTCTGQQPINVSFLASATGSPICATNQSATTGLTGLQAGCVTPTMNMPVFNKANFTSTMSTTINNDLSCTFMTRPTIANKTKIQGSVSGSYCQMTLGGDAYITGDFSAIASTIRVAEGVTSRPVIVVNGKVNFVFTTISPNSRGITPYIISFYSTNTTCMNDPTCNTVTNADIYDTVNGNTSSINIGNVGTIAASLYAYFGTLNISTSSVTGNLAGQKIIIGNNSTITSTTGVWPG